MNIIGWEPELNFAEESRLPKIDEFTGAEDLQNEKNKKEGGGGGWGG